jgi:hypothetical protein
MSNEPIKQRNKPKPGDKPVPIIKPIDPVSSAENHLKRPLNQAEQEYAQLFGFGIKSLNK